MTKTSCVLAALVCVACGPEEPPAVVPAPTATTAPAANAPAAFEVALSAAAEVEEGATTTLAGSVVGSQPGQKLAFEWKQLSGPNAVLATPNAATTIFIAPEAIADYELRFELAVARGSEVAKKELTLVVRANDDPPAAELYGPAGAECGERVVVTGQGRTLEPQRLRFAWRQFGDGPKVVLDEAGGSQASFLAPEISGTYPVWLELSVSDGVNPPAVARVKVDVICDARTAPLAAGRTRKLAAQPDVASALPRGHWRVDGSLTLTQSQAGHAAVATLRFEYDASNAVLVELTKNGDSANLRTYGVVRDGATEPWREPRSSGQRRLGEWPADQPLGFEFTWDGHELAFRWGPPGTRAQWPEPPFPVSFALASRPKALVLTVTGGEVELNAPLLTGL